MLGSCCVDAPASSLLGLQNIKYFKAKNRGEIDFLAPFAGLLEVKLNTNK